MQMPKKILIVYYSYSSHTKKVAEILEKLTCGTILRIVPDDPYPVSYQETVDRAKKEISSGYLPELKSPTENASGYDIIFVGSPNWWSTLAPPVAAYLARQNLSGKTIVPFCTHGGGGAGRVEQDIAAMCPDSSIQEAFVSYEDSAKETDVAVWLSTIKAVE